MCHQCVIDSVRQRMLTRRGFFGAAAASAAGAAALVAAGPAAAQTAAGGQGGAVDLTHTYDAEFPTFFGQPQISMKQLFNYAEHKFNLFELTVNEHTGTHIDAPLHFSADGHSVDEIAVSTLVAPLCVIDIRARAAENPDAQVTPDDIKAWIAAHGPIPRRACVAMNSGWAQHVRTPRFRNADDKGVMHFPGFHVEAAQMLIEDGNAASIAVDTLSLDHGPSQDFATHYAWLPTNRYGIENLAGLDELPPAGATIVVGAPKHRGGSGGPARIFALL
ncbi:MAG: cyclase [Paracoccaceae bacterium]|nr:MAG: cyclase [Paracoccaceae bacterium]